MTTPKEKIVPGAILEIDNRKKKHDLVLTEGPGSFLDGYYTPANGEKLIVVSKPKKYEGINCVKVSYKNTELFTYYCYIRYNTKPTTE